MTFSHLNLRSLLLTLSVLALASLMTTRGSSDPPVAPTAMLATSVDRPTLAELKRTGFERSRFNDLALNVDEAAKLAVGTGELQEPQANLRDFEAKIKPLLEQHCFECHNADVTEGNIRLDSLAPDLLRGGDTDWWAEVFAVVTKEEMPPPDSSELGDEERRTIVDWLSNELHSASILRRSSGTRSAFRRLTRYEYNYALQDLLGLPWDFAKDLPPEPHTEEGFENSADLLHLSVSQFETYHRLARQALKRATVAGDRPPTLYWGIAMQQAAEREWGKQTAEIDKVKGELAAEPEKLQAELARLEESFRSRHSTAYYKELSTGRTAKAEWQYYDAKYAFAPATEPPSLDTSDKTPAFPASFDCVAILPASGQNQNLVIELGNQLPDEGTLRVRVRASRVNPDQPGFPSLQLLFGWQASNEGRALLRVSQEDVAVTATPDQPQIVQWDIPLGEIYPRNNVRKTSLMGEMPSPSEYIRIANSSASDSDVQIDYVSVEAPFFEQWPPASHRRIFFNRDYPAHELGESLVAIPVGSESRGGFRKSIDSETELAAAREIIQPFMSRAWRRPIAEREVDRKLELFVTMREQSESFEEAVTEVLATVLSSPQFLYVANATPSSSETSEPIASPTRRLDAYALANRLSLFLWCSIPDDELLALASSGELSDAVVLRGQVERMLADPRSSRFAKHFVHQWLNMELLEFVNFERHVPNFDPLLKESMQAEPVAMFREMLGSNASVLDFVHSDYAMVNERLAKHYGLESVYGNEFRRVSLDGDFRRGGVVTQAGMLAMNSDWPDSHPLKRAIWLLERLLDDPPPPPPPAVPQIDLANPEIAKMTLKERIEDHRNQAACRSCHTKIDPWGIAFENYDALGRWRDDVQGKPVDAASELFNGQMIEGMDGLKRYLLEARQDQFVQAMVEKLATYALGRSLGFADRAEIDAITAGVRHQADGLKTMIIAIVSSELFQS